MPIDGSINPYSLEKPTIVFRRPYVSLPRHSVSQTIHWKSIGLTKRSGVPEFGMNVGGVRTPSFSAISVQSTSPSLYPSTSAFTRDISPGVQGELLTWDFLVLSHLISHSLAVRWMLVEAALDTCIMTGKHTCRKKWKSHTYLHCNTFPIDSLNIFVVTWRWAERVLPSNICISLIHD